MGSSKTTLAVLLVYYHLNRMHYCKHKTLSSSGPVLWSGSTESGTAISELPPRLSMGENTKSGSTSSMGGNVKEGRKTAITFTRKLRMR
jgi:hypothetical protein